MESKDTRRKKRQFELIRAYDVVRRYHVLIFVACLGITLSAVLFTIARGWEEKKIAAEFERGAENRISALRNTFEYTLHEIDALGSFYAASREVERFEFHTFTQHLLWHSQGIQALEWIPRVPHAQRTAFVEAARKEGIPDFEITERKVQGVMIKAARRSEYFPIYFVEPYGGNEDALGFDLASSPARREALEQARDTGVKAATARIKLVQEKGQQYGILISEPIYQQGMPADSLKSRRRHLRGFVLGVYRLGDMVEKSLSYLRPRGIDILLTDESAPEDSRFLYFHPSRLRAAPVPASMGTAELRPGLHYSETIDVAGRTWMIRCSATPGFLAAGKTWQPWGILGGGLLFTGLISGYLVLIQLRITRARQHAAELSQAKRGLELEIAAREHAEAERQKLILLVENSADFIGIASLEGKVLYVNKAGQRLAGLDSMDEVTKTTLADYLMPEDVPFFQEQVLPAAMKDGTWSGELRLRNFKTGSEIPMFFTGFLIRDASTGEPIALATVSRDITEEKKTEGELLRVQKLESLGALAGGLAHDFNNLLTAVLGNISVAKMYIPPDHKASERLAEAEKASLRTKDLTQQLLTFAKGGAPVKKIVSFDALIQESSGFVLRGSNITCECSIPNDLLAVEVDEGQINQVVNNLIINAVQAMPDGGTIRIACDNVTIGIADPLPLNEGDYVKITVRDHGIGIPQEHLQKIFDPYFTTKQKGSGLGLATSYSIVKRHGGHISVESDLGAGTAFHMYLPASEKQIHPEKEKDERPIQGTGTILVVDDEETVREVAGTMLKELGYDVSFARDGAEAIALYRNKKEAGQPFEAIIMDLTIPGGMGGKEAIQQLMEIDADVNAIVSSGYSNDPIMAEYKKFGFKGVVTKPYRISELSEAVHGVMVPSESRMGNV